MHTLRGDGNGDGDVGNLGLDAVPFDRSSSHAADGLGLSLPVPQREAYPPLQVHFTHHTHTASSTSSNGSTTTTSTTSSSSDGRDPGHHTDASAAAAADGDGGGDRVQGPKGGGESRDGDDDDDESNDDGLQPLFVPMVPSPRQHRTQHRTHTPAAAPQHTRRPPRGKGAVATPGDAATAIAAVFRGHLIRRTLGTVKCQSLVQTIVVSENCEVAVGKS